MIKKEDNREQEKRKREKHNSNLKNSLPIRWGNPQKNPCNRLICKLSKEWQIFCQNFLFLPPGSRPESRLYSLEAHLENKSLSPCGVFCMARLLELHSLMLKSPLIFFFMVPWDETAVGVDSVNLASTRFVVAELIVNSGIYIDKSRKKLIDLILGHFLGHKWRGIVEFLKAFVLILTDLESFGSISHTIWKLTHDLKASTVYKKRLNYPDTLQ